ncbi:hypothetical protein FQN57_001044 [Myotisia sp. PD_48]|nr:hypothetical protein FQN57_001044 [Myotisia sp. PD_48]
MARLNEAPPTIDSIESLKRRFIRQNREIARANSLQSMRIRSLESETSQLLSENIALREKILSLNQELDRYRSAAEYDNRASALRERFEAGICELSTLINDLGTLSSLTPGRSVDARKSEVFGSPTGLNRPTIRAVSRPPPRNVDSDDETRLPAILEDTPSTEYWTTNDEGLISETCRIENDLHNMEVPEGYCDASLHYESVTVDDTRVSHDMLSTPTVEIETNQELEIPTPFHLIKAKRRRRDCSPAPASPTSRRDAGEGRQAAPLTRRASSKRKLDVREDGDDETHPPMERDGFQYTFLTELGEKTPGTTETTYEKPQRHSSTKQVQKPRVTPLKPRGILQPKNGNTKTSSQKKLALDDECMKQPMLSRRKRLQISDRNSTKTLSTLEGTVSATQCEPSDISAHLIAPKLEDLSAKSLQPVAPVIDLNVEEPPDPESWMLPSDDARTLKPRQSRRSRGRVSYAEPSLRDKMRRPTEDLVDAI